MMNADTWREIMPKILAYRKLKGQADALKEQMDALRAELALLVEANGKWEDDQGYAKMVTRNPSVTFDTKALEALFQSVEAARQMLEPHRKIKPGYTYVQIR